MGKFSDVGDKLILGAVVGMEDFAYDVMADSLDQVPVDTGTLYRSARVIPPALKGKNIDVEFGYGYGDEINEKTKRPASEYAVPVHERTDVHHDPPTKAKYLEDPLFLHSNRMAGTMAESMRFYISGERIALGINTLGSFPIIGTIGTGQPILRIPSRGASFGNKP